MLTPAPMLSLAFAMGSIRVEVFLLRYDLYAKQEPLRFDLREYAAYMKKLTASDVIPEILAAFSRKDAGSLNES